MQGIPISGLMAGRFPVNDPGCASDGTALLHVMEFVPNEVSKSFYYSISLSREVHSFSFDQIPNIYDLMIGDGTSANRKSLSRFGVLPNTRRESGT